jgi:hypothetical protein
MATKPILVDLDFASNAKVINLGTPTAAGDAATKGYVDGLVEGLAWKDSARVATQANLNLAAPGATIDGVTMATNDRILVRNQTTTTENGIYIFNGSATPATRSLDANTFDELEQAVITVEEGTSAGATFRQSVVNGTIGSTAPNFTTFGTSAPAASETTAGIAELATQAETDAGTDDLRIVTPLKLKTSPFSRKAFAANFGDGSATSYTITHNLGTLDVDVNIFETGGSQRAVDAEIRRATTNSVTILTNVAPASNALRAVVTA